MRVTAFTQTPSQPARPDVVRSLNGLADRLAAAMPGEAITYHVGMLARDRWPLSFVLPEVHRLELNAIADRAQQLADAGMVHLVQRRLAEERFAYLLIVRPRPRRQATQRRPVPPMLMLAEAA